MPQINKLAAPVARGLRAASVKSTRSSTLASQHLLRQAQAPTAAPFSSTPRRENATPTDRIPSRNEKTSSKTGGNAAGVQNQLPDFNLSGKTYVITGGGGGLGLTLAEGLVAAGGNVYCIDRKAQPGDDWHEAVARTPEWGGSLIYRQQDVCDEEGMGKLINIIADENNRLDGCIAAAAIQQEKPSVSLKTDDMRKMMDINFTGVLTTANAVARAMMKHKTQGSICLIASMSGLVANKGLFCPVYNSSKAALIQLAKCLAMEWSPRQKDGSGGIRVNCISPGHIMTPMVHQILEERPEVADFWSKENMLGRLAETDEFKGAALYLMSNASSYMTGNNMVLDGGHTAW